jgi:hypothetical protein
MARDKYHKNLILAELMHEGRFNPVTRPSHLFCLAFQANGIDLHNIAVETSRDRCVYVAVVIWLETSILHPSQNFFVAHPVELVNFTVG